MIILGIDPGGAETGLAVRRGDEMLGHRVVTRVAVEHNYLHDVLAAAFGCVTLWEPHLVAVEGVVAPKAYNRGRLAMTNVEGLLGTATVLGALLGAFPGAVVVPPAGHGSGPLGAYPAELVGEREKRGTGRLRHCRSAWDIAGAALRQVRVAGKALA